MRKTLINKISAALVSVVLITSCAELEVENKNEPSIKQVLATPNDYKGLVAGSLKNTYTIFSNYRGQVNLDFTGDYITMTNNVNNWWSEFKVEPRPQFNNTLANANLGAVVSTHWALLNSGISTATTVIKAIEIDGLDLGADKNMVLASAYFAKGLAEGYVAVTHDQGYAVTAETDLSTVALSPYTDVMTQCLADLDKAIQISSTNSFTLDPTFLRTTATYSSSDLAKLANTYAAHFLMERSRTKAQNDANEWARILAYSQKGITQDYVLKDDGTNYNAEAYISGLDWYWRVDHRIIRTMDPNYPKRFATSTTVNTIPAAVSDDKRLTKYFKYDPSTARFNLTRGTQLRSHYRWIRWNDYYLANAVGNFPYYFKYISDLVKAEAMVMANNDVAGAVAILNAGNRVTVGELAPLNAANFNKQQILEVIWAERDIEGCLTEWAVGYLDARRRGILQKGVLLHMPVPANELLTLRLPVYTFGGQANADGVNTSDGSGSWLN